MPQPSALPQRLQSKISPKTALCLAWVAVLAVALFLRVYKISTYPIGLHVDEVGAAYDAWCLANYGTDRYGIVNPVYLINYGGGQSALYAYTMVPLFRLFGVSVLTIRLPMVFFGMVTVVCGGLLARKALGEKGGLVCAVLLACCPVFIASSRYGLDCYLLVGMSTAALYLLVLAVEKQQKRWFALAGVAFGVTLYTYAVSYIILPLFLAAGLLYLIHCRRVTVGQVVALAVPLALLAAPLIAMLVINQFDLPQVQVLGVTLTKLPAYRGSEVSLQNVWQNLCALPGILFCRDIMACNILPTATTLFFFTVPFCLWGFVCAVRGTWRAVRTRTVQADVLVLFFFLATVAMSLFIDALSVNRVDAVYFPLAFFAARGWCAAFSLLRRASLRQVAAGVFFLLYVGSGVHFLYQYFTYDNGKPMVFFSPALDGVVEQLQGFDGDVYIAGVFEGYAYYALAARLAPQQAVQLPATETEQIGHVYLYEPEEIAPHTAYALCDGYGNGLLPQLQTDAYRQYRYVNITLYVPVE